MSEESYPVGRERKEELNGDSLGFLAPINRSKNVRGSEGWLTFLQSPSFVAAELLTYSIRSEKGQLGSARVLVKKRQERQISPDRPTKLVDNPQSRP